jgi:hypothetical protein
VARPLFHQAQVLPHLDSGQPIGHDVQFEERERPFGKRA